MEGQSLDVDLVKPRLDELLTQGRHGELRGEFRVLNEVDIAEYLKTLNREHLLVAFRTLPKDKASDVFAYMDFDQREALSESVGDVELSALVDEMFIDDAVDFLEELPAELVKRILQFTDRARRETIQICATGDSAGPSESNTARPLDFTCGGVEELKRPARKRPLHPHGIEGPPAGGTVRFETFTPRRTPIEKRIEPTSSACARGRPRLSRRRAQVQPELHPV